jgi:hypothetical protein
VAERHAAALAEVEAAHKRDAAARLEKVKEKIAEARRERDTASAERNELQGARPARSLHAHGSCGWPVHR